MIYCICGDSKFLTNYSNITFLDKLKDCIKKCNTFCFSVSFIKKVGLTLFTRELEEALDSDIVVDKYLMTVEHDYPTFHITMHAYLCTLVKGELTLKEHNDSIWLTKEELLSLDWADADRPIVNKVLSRTR